jgi:prevent-host-death family protein
MTTLPLSDARARLLQLVRDAEELGKRFVITRSGRPAAVLISAEEFGGLLETLEILADPKLAAAVARGLGDVERGRLLSCADVWRALNRPADR